MSSITRARSAATLAAAAARRTQRGYAALAINASRAPPLDVAPSGLPQSGEFTPRAQTAVVSTLANGVKVAALPGSGPLTSIGVFVGCGTRAAAPAGVAEVLRHAIYSTTAQRSNIKQVRLLEQTGARVASDMTRDALKVTANVVKGGAVGDVLKLLADGICAARLSDYDVSLALENATAGAPRFCIKSLAHSVAFRFVGLGAVRGVPAGAHVSAEHVLALRNAVVVPSNIVVAGVGIDAAELAKLAGECFGALPASGPAPARAASRYYGGETVQFDVHGKTSGVVALEAGGLKHDVVFSVARELLAEACTAAGAGTAFYHPYSDSGLIGARFAGNKAEAVAAAIASVRGAKFTDASLGLARRRAAAAYLFSLESQANAVRDLGKQVLLTGAFRSAEATVAAINAVSAADVKAALETAAKKPVTLVTLTGGEATADYATVSKAVRA